MTKLHPLLRVMDQLSLRNLDSRGATTLIDAAESDGVTPAERNLLQSTRDRYSRTWSTETKRVFDRQLANAPKGPKGIRSSAYGPEAEDLSSRMKTVWMQGLDDEAQSTYVADMARLGAELGFNLALQLPGWMNLAGVARGLIESTGLTVEELDKVVDVVPADSWASVWGEDNKIMTNGNNRTVSVLVPPDISEGALYKAEAFTSTEGYHPYVGGFQGAVDGRDERHAAAEMGEDNRRQVRVTKTYMEGGNVTPGTTPEGKPYALVGRDSIIISAFHLEETGQFSRRDVTAKKRKMANDGRLNNRSIEETAKQLLLAKRATSYNAPRRVNDALRAEAADFQAKIELTKEIMAEDLDLPVDALVVVTQPEFHIDMNIRPLAPGEVMVNHPDACIEAIDEALRDPRTPRWEKTELRQMRRNAEAYSYHLGHVYDQIKSEIEDAGLIAIEAPGAFESHYRQANFMNAVPGTTMDGEQYFLTNASSLSSLERVFARFAKQYGVDRVEFLGGGGDENYLSASEMSLEMSGGLDCREVNHGGSRRPSRDLSRALGIA